MSKSAASPKKSAVDRFLDGIERICNKLPPPGILFCILFVFVTVLGAIISFTGASVTNPATGDVVSAQNFFSAAGIQWLLANMVSNFTTFAPLGLVIAMTMAIGMCEESGLIMALLQNSLRNVPAVIIPYVIAFVGTVGNIASDTAMVIVPPVGAILYMAVGKHPVVGMICGYAGAQAGFSANLMVAGTDSLLQGITNTTLHNFLPESVKYEVDVTCNWFFMMASTFLCAAVIGWVCNHMVDQRFGKYEGAAEAETLTEVTPIEKKGLRNAGIAAILYIILILVGFFFGPLALVDDTGRHFLKSPLLNGLIPVLFFFFCICGIVYGFTVKKFKTATDVNSSAVKQMKGMGSYIVFCFFAGQFNKVFAWTKLDTMMAISGAEFLDAIGFTGIPLFIAFITLSMVVNLVVASGSAKWTIFAPIFVPMFMMLGYHPGFTQLLYRLGDSPTNAFTPMSPYIWMVLEVAKAKYDDNLKIGTLVSGLIPIAVVLQVIWTIFLVIWYLTGLPIGPGVTAALPAELAAYAIR